MRQLAKASRSAWRLSEKYVRGSYGAWRHRQALEDIETYCGFIGYSRSGHTLVGSLLNAHPNVVIAHELHVLDCVVAGLPRRQIFALIIGRDRWFGNRGRVWSGYDYNVEGQWQGRFETLRVIGDKRGGGSTKLLRRMPEALDRLRDTLALPLRFVHVIRNPYDNITTLALRTGRELGVRLEGYFSLVDTVQRVRCQLQDEELFDLHLESLIADPSKCLGRLCAFLGLPASEDYLAACAAVVFDSPRRTRFDAPWTNELIEQVAERAAAYDFLAGYRFDD